jgi:hypothetical protein
MDPFGMSPEQYTAAATWIAAIAAIGTLVVVTVTALYAKGQLGGARRLRLAQTRPFVVVSVDVEQRSMFMLTVENVGPVPARNVRVGFDQMPYSTITSFDEVRMLKEPIPTMPPGHKYSAYWELTFKVFDEKQPYPHPLTYRAEVTYEDLEGHAFGPEEYILDLRIFEGQAAYPKGLPELVKVVEDLRDEHKKWTVKGMLVRAIDEVTRERRNYRPIVIAKALRAKDNDGWRGFARYLLEHWQHRYGLYERRAGASGRCDRPQATL